MVRTLPNVFNLHLDNGRILAYAAVIAVHVSVALLLLIPLVTPPLDIRVAPDITPVGFVPPKPEIKQVVPETQPAKAQTVKQQTVANKQTVTPSAETPVAVEGDTFAVEVTVEPATDTSTVGSVGESIGPVSVNQLAYLTATPPPYPRAEQIAGIQGTVLLRILVDTNGAPLEVTVERSSGNRNLDRSAQRHVLKSWRFQPAMQNGHAVQAYGLVPVVFSMQ
jgi:protein TonB